MKIPTLLSVFYLVQFRARAFDVEVKSVGFPVLVTSSERIRSVCYECGYRLHG